MLKKIIMGFLCLYGASFSYTMEPLNQITPYFSCGEKDVRTILIKNQSKTVGDVRDFLLPFGLSCQNLYNELNQVDYMRSLVSFCSDAYKKPQGAIAKQLKMESARQYIDLNQQVFVGTMLSYLSPQVLAAIYFSFDMGADPNFASHRLGRTPLMRAVACNSLELVDFLMEKGASIHAVDQAGRSVRSFNIIYNEKKLKNYLSLIIDYMLKLETHNAIHSQEPLNCEIEMFADADARELRIALYIDKILENRGAQFPLKSFFEHPLLIVLAQKKNGPLVKKALQAMYDNDNGYIFEWVPRFIRSLLYVPNQ